jgi:hypothetical protein
VYEVVDYLGIGMFSLVFRVKKLETGKFYAAKISRQGGFGKEGSTRQNTEKKLKTEYKKQKYAQGCPYVLKAHRCFSYWGK